MVSIDAIGCQKEIISQIVAQQAETSRFSLFCKQGFGTCRAEERKVYLLENVSFIDAKEDWAGLKSIAMVERKVWRKGKEQNSKHFYISSLLVLVPKKWDNIFVTTGR